MDDITITTMKHLQARWVLEILDNVASLARMLFKARKSRTLVIKKGRVTSKFSLQVQGEVIPSIVDNLVQVQVGRQRNCGAGSQLSKAARHHQQPVRPSARPWLCTLSTMGRRKCEDQAGYGAGGSSDLKSARAVEQGSRGAWTKWNLPKRKVTWTEPWQLVPYHISFLLRSVYNTLPLPSPLHTWGLREDPFWSEGDSGTHTVWV